MKNNCETLTKLLEEKKKKSLLLFSGCAMQQQITSDTMETINKRLIKLRKSNMKKSKQNCNGSCEVCTCIGSKPKK